MMACKQATALLSARSPGYGGMISVFGVMIFLFNLAAFADFLDERMSSATDQW